MDITCALHDHVGLSLLTIDKIHFIAFGVANLWHLLHVAWERPFDWLTMVTDDHLLSLVLVTLNSNIFSGQIRAHDEYSLVGNILRVSKIMGVHDSTTESIEAGVFAKFWVAVMTRATENVVIRTCDLRLIFVVVGHNVEFLCGLVKSDRFAGSVERNVFFDSLLGGSALHVIFNYSTWHIRWDVFPKVLLKCIGWELQCFFGSVCPKTFVHSVVDWLAVRINSRLPRVVPHSTPVCLFIKAIELRSLISQFIECVQDRQATGSSSNNGYFKF